LSLEQVLAAQGRISRKVVGTAALPDIRVTGYCRQNGVMFYSVEVEGARYMKRYNQFLHLRKDLQRVSGLPAETRSALRHFPRRTHFWECERPGSRRKAFDVWMVELLGSVRRMGAEQGEAWKGRIRAFLSNLAEEAPPVAVEELRVGAIGVSMPSYAVSDGTAFYRVDITGETDGEASRVVWRSYKQFDDLHKRIDPKEPRENQGENEIPTLGTPFPSKLLFIHGVDLDKTLADNRHEARTLRRQGLAQWLKAAVAFAKSDATVAQEVSAFLSPGPSPVSPDAFGFPCVSPPTHEEVGCDSPPPCLAS